MLLNIGILLLAIRGTLVTEAGTMDRKVFREEVGYTTGIPVRREMGIPLHKSRRKVRIRRKERTF